MVVVFRTLTPEKKTENSQNALANQKSVFIVSSCCTLLSNRVDGFQFFKILISGKFSIFLF